MLRRNMSTADCPKSGAEGKTLGLHSAHFSERGDGNTRLNPENYGKNAKITRNWSSWDTNWPACAMMIPGRAIAPLAQKTTWTGTRAWASRIPRQQKLWPASLTARVCRTCLRAPIRQAACVSCPGGEKREGAGPSPFFLHTPYRQLEVKTQPELQHARVVRISRRRGR